VGILTQFSWTDYLLALPMTLLTLFALGILLIDFMLPTEMKWANAVTAFIGVTFAASDPPFAHQLQGLMSHADLR